MHLCEKCYSLLIYFSCCHGHHQGNIQDYSLYLGHAVAQLVEELRYKPEVMGLIPDCVIGIFH